MAALRQLKERDAVRAAEAQAKMMSMIRELQVGSVVCCVVGGVCAAGRKRCVLCGGNGVCWGKRGLRGEPEARAKMLSMLREPQATHSPRDFCPPQLTWLAYTFASSPAYTPAYTPAYSPAHTPVCHSAHLTRLHTCLHTCPRTCLPLCPPDPPTHLPESRHSLRTGLLGAGERRKAGQPPPSCQPSTGTEPDHLLPPSFPKCQQSGAGAKL
eukprot:28666-Chlamydomonas_euryale.AAC.1